MDEKVTEARENYKLATGSANYNLQKENFRESLRFYDGDQWDEETKDALKAAQRVPLTINQCAPAVQQVVNDQRQNRPAVKISPVDGGADKETAQFFQGAIRHIEYRSSADTAYDTAFESAAAGGFGYWRIITEYATPEGFDQELKIKRVPDALSVVLDPHASEPDGSDIEYGFIEESVSKAEHKRRWGEAEGSQAGFFDSSGASAMGDWLLSEDSVRVAEYWYIRHEKRKRLLLATGMELWPDDEDWRAMFPDGIPEAMILQERDVDRRSVHQCITNGLEALEKADWVGRWIPIVPVYGKELHIDGKRIFRSMIWNSFDSQRLLNSAITSARETAGLTPKIPWIGYLGQFKSDPNWADAARGLVPYLQADIVAGPDGQVLPLPQRTSFEPAIQALTILGTMGVDFIKSTTGLHGPSLGEEDANRSGRAILALQEEGDTANYHLIDNLSRSIAQSGRILLDLIPKVYDRERMVRIIGEDDRQLVERVAANFNLAENGAELLSRYLDLDEKGRKEYQRQFGYQIDVGQYDVTSSTGPSYQTKRQQSADQMLELAKIFPEPMNRAIDILVGALDLVQAEEIKKRVIPPEFAEEDGAEVPPQIRMQLQQLEGALNDAMDQLDEANKKIDGKVVEGEYALKRESLRGEIQSRIQEAKGRIEVLIEMMGNESAESVAQFKGQIEAIKNVLDVEAAMASQSPTQKSE